MKAIYVDTEVIGYATDFPGEDILCQLAYLYQDNKELTIYSDYMKPNRYKDSTPGAMSVTKLVPEFLEKENTKENTKSWVFLKDLLENTKEIVYLVAHNIKFDLEVLELSGIKPNSNVRLICTLKIANFINDSTNLQYIQCTLGYIKYFYRLDLLRKQLDLKLGIDSTKLENHNAIPDILDLFLIYKNFIKLYNASEEQFSELTSKDMLLNLIPFGKNKGERFDSLSINQLKYYSTLDGNVAYTANHWLEISNS